MFEGFETRRIALEGVTLNTRLGGEGPPLLLLHGYPQTHERCGLKPSSPQNWTLVARAHKGLGNRSHAERAQARATSLLAA